MRIELFSSSGGMAKGFHDAGIDFDMVIDADPAAVDSYEKNLGHRPIQMDVRDVLRMLRLGWKPRRRVKLLIADPPCTPWSRAGKRKGMADERDMLAETMEIIAALRPERWLVANIPGLDDNVHWDSVVKPVIGGTAERLGYCVDFASLNAANYGVPQMRVRPFWFAHERGTPCIRWPAPTHCDPAELATATLPGIAPLKPWVTCRQALEHLPPEQLGKPVRLRWRKPAGDEPSLLVTPRHPVAEPTKPAPTVTAKPRATGAEILRVSSDLHPPSDIDKPANTIGAGAHRQPCGVVVLRDSDTLPRVCPICCGKMIDAGRAAEGRVCDGCDIISVGDGPRALMRPQEPDRPARTVTGNRQDSSHILASRQIGAWENGNHLPSRADDPALVQTAADGSASGVMAPSADGWPWNRPATTVMADERMPPPGHHGGKNHMSRGIKLSERARLILQAFPEDWVLAAATKTGRASMLGQAVPPPLARAVAGAIRDHEKRSRRSRGKR